jgi:hypothetical protein
MNEWQMDLVRTGTEAPRLLEELVRDSRTSGQVQDLRDVI